MAVGNQKLIGQLSLGLETLRTNVKDANKILEGISAKKLNLDIIDEKTKNKLIETAKIIKKEIEAIGRTGTDTSQTKALVDGLLKSFSAIQIKAKEMQPIVTETFKKSKEDALASSKAIEQANKTVSESYDKLGRKIAETKTWSEGKDGTIKVGQPTTKIVTDDSTAKLTKISTAYNKLTTEQKSNEKVMTGMANEVQKVIDKYGLQGKALDSATSQSSKYRTAAEQIIQTEIRARDSVDAAINKTIRARETERQSQERAQSNASNKSFEDQYKAKIKATEQSIKQAQAIEKQGLAELKLYTQEKAQTSQYSQMAQQLARISGESKLAMSSSNASNDMMSRFKISAAYTVATTSIFMLRNAVKDMIQTNKEFEVGLVELGRILGNLSANELKAFGDTAIQIAKEFGEPLREVQAAMSALAAAGVQNQNDLKSMSRTVTMGLNTSTIKSASEMTDLLTSSMKQMNISFSDSERVLDKWNYLGDKSIATTADFAQAISKAGATSLSLGISMDQLNGMVAVLSNSTGASGTQIGDALKSIESRLLRPETLDVLKKYGIETMKDANHFKDFGSIITDVSTQLDKFGENTTQSTEILDALGGTMRKNWINLLARDYDQVDSKAQESAIESIGYSAEKSALTMDTLDKKIANFNNTIKELYIGVGNNGLTTQLKGLVDLGTWLAEGGSKIAGLLLTLGEVSIALKVISGTMSVIKGQSLTQIFDKMNLSWMQTASNAINLKGVSFSGDTTSVLAYKAAVNSLQKDIAAGNITMAQSSSILGGMTSKLGLSATGTNILAAAEASLNIKREGSIALETALRTEMLASGMTQTQITAAIAARTVTEQSLSEQLIAKTITEAQYDVLMKERIVTQAVMNADMANLTVTTGAASIAAKEKAAADAALNATQIATASSAKGLQMAMVGLTLGITAALMIGIPFIQWLSKADERQQKLLADGADLAKKYDEESKSLSDLVKSYQELSTSGKVDTDTKKQLLDIQTKLVSSYGSEAEGLDLVNGKYQEQIDKLQKVSKEKASEYIRDNQKSYNGATESINESSKYHVTAISGNRIGKITSEIDGVTSRNSGGSNIEYAINGTLSERIEILKKILDSSGKISDQNVVEKATVGRISEEYSKLKKELVDANEIIQKMSSAKLMEGYSGQLGEMSTSAAAFRNAIANNDVDAAKKAKESLSTLKASMEETLSKSPELKKAFLDWSNGLTMTGDSAKVAASELNGMTMSQEQLKQKIEDLDKSYSDSISKLESYNKILKEIDENGSLSAASTNEIISKHKELAPYLDDTKELYKQTQIEIAKQEEVAKTTYNNMMLLDENFNKEVYKNTTWLSDMKSKWYNTDLTNYANLGQGKLDIEKSIIKQVAGMWADYYDAQGNLMTEAFGQDQGIVDEDGTYMGSKSNKNKMDKAFGIQKEIATKFKLLASDFAKVVPQVDFKGMSKDMYEGKDKKSPTGSNSAEKQINEALILKDRYYSLNQELLKTQNLLDTNASLQVNSEVNDNLKEKIDLQKQEIELLKKKQIAQKNIENEQIKERSEITSTLKTKGVTFSGLDPTNANVILQSKLDAANAHRNDKDKTTFNALKTAYEEYNTSLERFFALQNTEIPKSKAEYLSLSTEIYKVSESLDSLNLDNLNSSLEDSVSNSEFLIRNLEFSSKYNYASDDYINQLEILKQKESTYASMVAETKNTLIELNKTQTTTVSGQKELSNSISTTTETLRSQTSSMIDAQKAQEDLVKSQVKSLIETQKKIDEINLKKRHEKEKDDLSSNVYGGKGTADENIKAYDKENQRQQDAIQEQIDNLNKVNDIQEEIETRLKNQNDLIEKQTALKNAQNNKTVQTLKKNEDGSFQFKYVADISAVESAQNAVNDQIKSNNSWEKSTSQKHEIERLNALKKSLADQKSEKDKSYAERLATLEVTQTKETEEMTLHYANIDALVTIEMDKLKGIYGTKWDEMLKLIGGKLSEAEDMFQKLQGILANIKSTNLQISDARGATNNNADETVESVTIGDNTYTRDQINNPKYEDRINADIVSGKEIKVKNVAGYDTGGETGTWGNSGKLAMLHQKERVLSSTQTKDFGQLVTYLPSALTSIESIMDKISLSNVNGGQVVKAGDTYYQIAAVSFPDANSVDEIIGAFKSLPSAIKQKSS